MTEDGRWLSKDKIGLLGEHMAGLFLRRQGLKILYTNFQAPRGGEIDVICRHKDTLVFVEVKTRTSLRFGRPVEAVTEAKQRLITRGALEWLRMLHFPDICFRFDVVEVLLTDGSLPDLNRVENAFQMPEPNIYPQTEVKESR